MIKLIVATSKIDSLKKDIGFDVIIKQTKIAKKMSLKIDTKERKPVLTLPRHFSKKLAIEFLEKNEAWIEEKIKAIPKEKTFKFDDVITLLGKEYVIKECLDCVSNCKIKDGFLLAPKDKRLLHSRIVRFVKALAKDELLKLSKKKAKLIGGELNSVCIKDTKSRWGSCSSKGNINYNFRLLYAPKFVCEAIVCHEVCHLREHNHGKDFYDLLYSICPDYDAAEKWLKNNSKELYLYK